MDENEALSIEYTKSREETQQNSLLANAKQKGNKKLCDVQAQLQSSLAYHRYTVLLATSILATSARTTVSHQS